ncbi:MAG: trimethylamine methyltransferase family protein [Anaerolineaceae bacterium]|nr:trimethylamine methyltransferase family protein [Anaerolineaceae bacterium]
MMQLTVLSNDELEAIHRATLKILENTGVRLTHPDAMEILSGNGCRVKNERILIPPELVESELKKCPSSVSIRGRGGKTLTLGDGKLHFHNCGGVPNIIDQQTGNSRPATIQDLQDSTRILDALDGIDEVIPLYTPQDVPAHMITLAMYRHTLSHTTKPVPGPGLQNADEVRYIREMVSVLGPPEEMLTISISPLSPLNFPDNETEAIIETARSGIPFRPLPSPTTGATAPMSLAGALALQNAEILTSIVLAQLLYPGLPVIYCSRLAILEPRTGGSSWGVPTLGLAAAACTQLGHYYSLPVNAYGLATDSNQMDIQNGYERALNATLPALAGADELSGVGDMGAGTVSSHAQLICDNDLALMIKHLRGGVKVNPDTLAIDLIHEVVNSIGHFLAEKHTVQYLRSGEVFYPKLADRRLWDEWDQSGRGGMTEKAVEQAEKLLQDHEAPPLADEQEEALDEIMKAAQDELVK